MNDNLKVLLFDLGGVLLRLNDPIETFGLDISEREFKERWLHSPTVREFEAGGIVMEEFARKIVNEVDLPYGWQEFIERFNSWPGELYEETLSVLEAIPTTYSRALLSNINEWHWGREEISGKLLPYINRAFLSFETGFVKPDPEAFELVVTTYQCRPDEILFLDDTHSSVSAAADCGLQAELATGIDSVRKSLVAHGVIV